MSTSSCHRWPRRRSSREGEGDTSASCSWLHGSVWVCPWKQEMTCRTLCPRRQSELSVKLNRQLERCLRNSKCIDTESLCVVSGEKVTRPQSGTTRRHKRTSQSRLDVFYFDMQASSFRKHSNKHKQDVYIQSCYIRRQVQVLF